MTVSAARQRKQRRRGGASAPCPECRGNSRVLETRRGDNGVVTRVRQCLDEKDCGHRFVTHERARREK